MPRRKDINFDCIVIGAGVQGSFTAYQLAKKNKKTLLLEQVRHEPSHFDQSLTSLLISFFEDFFSRCRLKFPLISTFRQTGLLFMGPEKSENHQNIKDTLQTNKIPMLVLTHDIFSQHIPNVNLAKGDGALVDTTAGVLFADRTLKAVQGQFQKLGGVIRDNEKVTDIKPGPVVRVSTSVGVYHAKSLVITAGPWANKLLANTGLQLPLEVLKLKINVCYWKEKVPGSYSMEQRFPCFIQTECLESKVDIYGLPSNEYPGLMKVCYHMGSKTDPDQRDLQKDRSDIEILQHYITRCFPGLIPEPAIVESCMYTLTPDHHFVLDYHPAYSNIVIGAGFSGHGFKFGPIIGKLLCELSLGEVPSYDLSPFHIRRFQSKTNSAL
uniref:Pipecolic acid oxidase n=1 Tax=Neolamprologus brichardi TaxID=32507 RepID=A0A3Q4MFG1_NEOBR